MTEAMQPAKATSKLSTTDVNRWFPSTYNRGPNWLVWLGILSSFVAIFIKLWTPISINRIPETLYTLPFFYVLYKNFHWLKKEPIIQLFFAALLWPVIAFGINYLQDPELALKYQKLDNLIRLFLFVPIAWWLGGNARTLGWYLVTAFAGLLMAALLDPELEKTLKLLTRGRRVDFNILNAQHVSLYFAIALIGVLSVTRKVFTSVRALFDVWKPILWAVALLLCLTVILGTQTRAAWFALTVCTLLWVIQLALQYRTDRPGAWFLASALIVSTIAGLASYHMGDTVNRRIQMESDTINQLTEGNWDNIPYSSIGVRVNTWLEALHWIGEKPITGWGGDVRKDVIQQAEQFPSSLKKRTGHFHNSYVEFALAYGLVGLAIMVGPFIYLFRSLLHPDNDQLRWARSFSFYSMVLFLVMNAFESYIFFWSGIYVATVILVSPASALLNQNHPTRYS